MTNDSAYEKSFGSSNAEGDRILLARLDERMKGISGQVASYQQAIVSELAGIRGDISSQNSITDRRLNEINSTFDRRMELLERNLESKITSTANRLDNVEEDYVMKTSFEPVVKVVYGAVALILLTFGSLVISFFTGKPIP